MSLRFLRNATLLFVFATASVLCATLNGSLEEGKNFYFAGDLKRAISQFKSEVQENPHDPEPYLWLGKSYGLLADIKAPIAATRARLKARMYLSKAVSLSPGCEECRRELFDFFLYSDGSPAALKQAQGVLSNMRESDADYPEMRLMLAEAGKQNSSVEAMLSQVTTFPTRKLAALTIRPESSLRKRESLSNDRELQAAALTLPPTAAAGCDTPR